MDIEHPPKIPRRQQRRSVLRFQAYNLANRLSGGAWEDKEIKTIGLQRTLITREDQEFVRSTNRETPLIIPGIKTIINMTFTADKIEEVSESGTPYDYVSYKLTSSTSQALEEGEMPELVRQAIEDFDDEFDDDDNEHDINLAGEDEEYVDESIVEREEEVVYQINDYGMIDYYGLSHRYKVDDEEFYAIEYNTDNDVNDASANVYVGERVMERHTKDLPPLQEAHITQATSLFKDTRFEESYRHLIKRTTEEDSIARKIAFGGLNETEHIRRALGMLGMITSNPF